MPIKLSKKLYTFGRCTYADTARRQCRSLITDHDSVFCERHSSHIAGSSDFSLRLLARSHQLRCATGINNTFLELFDLLASDAISNTRAATLTRMLNAMLRTLPQIAEERGHPCLVHHHAATPQATAVINEFISDRDTFRANSQPQAKLSKEKVPTPEAANQDELTQEKSRQEKVVNAAPAPASPIQAAAPTTPHPSADILPLNKKPTLRDVNRLAELTRDYIHHESIAAPAKSPAARISPEIPAAETLIQRVLSPQANGTEVFLPKTCKEGVQKKEAHEEEFREEEVRKAQTVNEHAVKEESTRPPATVNPTATAKIPTENQKPVVPKVDLEAERAGERLRREAILNSTEYQRTHMWPTSFPNTESEIIGNEFSTASG